MRRKDAHTHTHTHRLGEVMKLIIPDGKISNE